MATKKSETISIQAINPKTIKVKIVGDTDLIINKMSASSERDLIGRGDGKAKSLDAKNKWEDIITSIHWRDEIPDTFSEEVLRDLLTNNCPCFPSIALKKSCGDAVVRNHIATYKTGFDATCNILAKGGLVPFKFTEHCIDTRVFSPKGRGGAQAFNINRFVGWSAEVTLSYLENVYSTEQFLNILNLTGYGIGICGNRKLGYGRFHVENAD